MYLWFLFLFCIYFSFVPLCLINLSIIRFLKDQARKLLTVERRERVSIPSICLAVALTVQLIESRTLIVWG
jgi:amino acid transporter